MTAAQLIQVWVAASVSKHPMLEHLPFLSGPGAYKLGESACCLSSARSKCSLRTGDPAFNDFLEISRKVL